MPVGAARMMMGRQAAAGGAFNPETDITWHSLFWAEGTAMTALAYSDGATVTSWPNETAESDATPPSTGPTFDTSDATLSNKPAVAFSAAAHRLTTTAFTTNPTYPINIIVIGYSTPGDSIFIDGRTMTAAKRNQVAMTPIGSSYQSYANGTPLRVGSTSAAKHGLRWKYTGDTGSETIHVDGSLLGTANSGSAKLDGLTIGDTSAGDGYNVDGAIAFVGVYEGDITSDGAWADFQTWASDHYGVTI